MGLRLPDGHVLEPSTAGLLVFDALERARADFESAGAIETISRLLDVCRTADVPVFYARADHRSDGRDRERCAGDTDSSLRRWSDEHPAPTRPSHGAGSPALSLLPELAPAAGDYDIPKHRWSAFQGTWLELSLRARGIDTVLLVGGSTHVGIAATAYAGRDLDFHVVVVADACAGHEEQRTFFLERVFPRMCHVLTVDEVAAALGS